MMQKVKPKYTVATLIKALEKLDKNLPVLVSQDPEGNGFSPLWSMEAYGFDLNSYEPTEEGGTMSLVLWP